MDVHSLLQIHVIAVTPSSSTSEEEREVFWLTDRVTSQWATLYEIYADNSNFLTSFGVCNRLIPELTEIVDVGDIVGRVARLCGQRRYSDTILYISCSSIPGGQPKSL